MTITRVGLRFGSARGRAFTEADLALAGIANSHTGRNPCGIFCRSNMARLAPSICIAGQSCGVLTTIRAKARPFSPNTTQPGVRVGLPAQAEMKKKAAANAKINRSQIRDSRIRSTTLQYALQCYTMVQQNRALNPDYIAKQSHSCAFFEPDGGHCCVSGCSKRKHPNATAHATVESDSKQRRGLDRT